MTKKKKIVLFSIIGIGVIATIAFWPFYSLRVLFLLLQGEVVIRGIERYSSTNSDVELCRYLTVRDEQEFGSDYKKNYFYNKYPYEEAFYQCVKTTKKYTTHETVVMALSYDNNNYQSAYLDVTSQKGFSEKITFDYKSFSFFLNNTERLLKQDRCNTDYCLDGNAPYIEWINLVGFNEETKTIAFVGFYHCEQSGYSLEIDTPYPFNNWEILFSENYVYYDFC